MKQKQHKRSTNLRAVFKKINRTLTRITKKKRLKVINKKESVINIA